MLLKPELKAFIPDWNMLRAVVVISSVVLARAVLGIVAARVDKVVATVATVLVVFCTRRSSKCPGESSAEIPGKLSDLLGLLIHSASGEAKSEKNLMT
jgi:hypothetical protein